MDDAFTMQSLQVTRLTKADRKQAKIKERSESRRLNKDLYKAATIDCMVEGEYAGHCKSQRSPLFEEIILK
jgi:hypothetical protein